MIKRKVAMGLMVLMMTIGTVFTPFTEQSTVQAAASYTNLHKAVNAVMAEGAMRNANSSVTVRKASDGEIVYAHQADKGITPASSLKLLTAAAALELLGEDFRFRTEVLTDGGISSGNVLHGDLYLKGMGDPTLLKRDFDNFAVALKKAGVHRITGNLIGDDTYFDKERLSPGIERNDESYYYAAQISALSVSPNEDYDTSTVIVDARPGARNRAANVTLTPATDVVRVINRSKTVAKGNRNTLRITRQYRTNNIVITGNAPIGSGGKREFIAVSNPTSYALDVFKKSLTAQGIKLGPSSKVAYKATPENARVLVAKDSMPLKALMIPFMKLSNNSHAEVLAKTMGKVVRGHGNWYHGLKAMRRYATSIGLDESQWFFEDGSGMSQRNKVTSSQLTELLYTARLQPWSQSFLQGLPFAGSPAKFTGGTLRNRMRNSPTQGNVIAKTGSLDNVKALAGYVKTRDGEQLIFTILTENHKASTIPSIDRLTTAIANSKK